MRSIVRLPTALLLCLGLWAPALFASVTWWHLCGSCQSDEQFQSAALSAPAPDGLILVSNPTTLESRQFERRRDWKPFGDGLIPVFQAIALPLSDRDRQVLAQIIERSRDFIVVRDRENLPGTDSENPPPLSLLADVQNGNLDGDTLHRAWRWLQDNYYFSTVGGVSMALDMDVMGISFEGLGQVDGLRSAPFRMVIRYADGSRLDFLVQSDAEFTNLGMSDAEGASIPVVDPDGPGYQIDGPSLRGRSFEFGQPSEGALTDLRRWLRPLARKHDLNCSVNEGGDRVRIACAASE